MSAPEHVNALGFSDSALRCAEQINIHVAAGARGKWAAIRLSDGGSDGMAYDSKADAVRHQLHETQCCYVTIPLTPMNVWEAQGYMDVNRQLYNAGMRLSDPKAPDAMIPIRTENHRARRFRRLPFDRR